MVRTASLDHPLPADAHLMQCMEIWGGNTAVDTGVVMPGLDAWVFSSPFGDASGAGGDIHYVTSCATGRVTRMVVADVSGHGAAVASVAEMLRRLMRKYSNYVDQSRFVEALNRQFGELGRLDDRGLFATAVVATYFAPTAELSICNAGHPRPMLYRAGTGAWEVVLPGAEGASAPGPANLPLGVVEPTRYPTTSLKLSDGDLVLLYTDSLIEAKDAQGRLLGERGLLEVLRSLDPNAGTLIPSLLEKIQTARPQQAGFDDDVTAMLIRRNAREARPSIALSVCAAARVAWSALTALLPGGLPAALPEISVRNLGGAAWRGFNLRKKAER